ncbi:hypothetical protein NCC49_005290 [Naganishia albida]|nr:hypothetical protein NCC49_005290 [Naganishia albida]
MADTNPAPPPDPAPGPAKEKKTRSRSGCYTCRRRKKACDHVHPVCGNCLRLEIPCIYQKVGNPTKKRKRRKDSHSAEDDAEGEDDAAQEDPEIVKAKEKPFYSLLEQTSTAPNPAEYAQGSLTSGYQLPFHPSDGFSLDLGAGMDMMQHLGGIPPGDGIASYPTLEPNHSSIQRPTDNPLAVFSQLLGINNPFPGAETARQSPRHGQAPPIPSPTWPQDAHLLTPSQPTLDIVFSPSTSRRGASFHESPDDNGVTPNGQDSLEEISSATAVRPFSPNTAQLMQQFINSAANTPERPVAATTDHLHLEQVTSALPSWLWGHVPNLIDYFVKGFAPVISVLGKPERNRLLNTLLPATSNSPILLHALVGWAASHLAVAQPSRGNGGEVYTSIARITTSIADQHALVKINSMGLPVGRDGEEELSLENEMWLFLILGGIEVCCGSIAKWNKRLPYIRNLMWRLESSLPSSNTNSMSSVHMSLALNCIYHDITGSLATTRDPGIPLRVYETFIRGSLAEPDVYMGASATVYQVYAEIAMLAAQVSSLDNLDPTTDTSYTMRDLLLAIHSCAGKIDTLDIHPNIARVVDNSPEDALDNHHLVLAFHMHKLAARLLLRQTCLRSAPSDIESRLLCARLLSAIQPVLHTPSEAQILLPLFLAGVDAITHDQKAQVMQIFKSTRQRTGCENAHAVYGLLKQVWAVNGDGRTWVDWRALAERSEAVISFA